jgi:hypothetical protein
MWDAFVYLSLGVSSALFVTAHVSTAYGPLWRPPRWRAPVALLMPPLGALWAWREGLRVRVIASAAGVFGYAFALAASSWRG